MGYVDKLHQLCAMRGFDQATLAQKVGVSKSSMSRILSGTQEPKLKLAFELAQALGVSLDTLVNDALPVETVSRTVPLTEEQLTILSIVDRLGYDAAIDRLLAVGSANMAQSRNDRDDNGSARPAAHRSASVIGVVASATKNGT